MNQQVRVSKSVGGMLAVIAFTNVVLLVGLFALGWPPGIIAFLFWFEAAVTGAVTFIKVAASSPGEFLGPGRSVSYVRLPRPGETARVSSSMPRVNGYAAPPLFIAFYGALLAAYAALLIFSLKQWDYPELVRRALSSDGVRLAMLLMVGEHLWAFWQDFVRGPAWQRADPTFHFWKPFGLAALVWLGFVLGFVVLGWLHSPLVVLTVLIVLKAIAELLGTLIDVQAGEWRRTDEIF